MIRPLPQAQSFVQALTAQMVQLPQVIYSPVIEIRVVKAPLPPQGAQYLLFTSVNGVKFYAEVTKNRETPALCVGDTTAAAAHAAGFKAQSANGTAQDLIRLAQTTATPENGLLIYVSGAKVAHDIDKQLQTLGFQTERLVFYEQIQHSLTKEARSALKSPTVIPIASPNTARIFADQAVEMDLSQVTMVFISETARKPLQHVDCRQFIAETPTREGMIAAVSSLF
jgi:uroporphyrinogen-III synthase